MLVCTNTTDNIRGLLLYTVMRFLIWNLTVPEEFCLIDFYVTSRLGIVSCQLNKISCERLPDLVIRISKINIFLAYKLIATTNQKCFRQLL